MIKIGIIRRDRLHGAGTAQLLAAASRRRDRLADVGKLGRASVSATCSPCRRALGQDVRWSRAEDADLGGADVVFCCLPHVAAQDAGGGRAQRSGARVIDLSADFRLHDPATYESVVRAPAHRAGRCWPRPSTVCPSCTGKRSRRANLVANPGCYPTSIILGLAPLARAGWLRGPVIADSKSGVSGAGRTPSLKTHFVEANENISPYSIGRTHRHLAEMEQELGLRLRTARRRMRRGSPWQIIFSPHLLPVNRGILSTIYVTLPAGVTEAEVRERCTSRCTPASRSSTCCPPGQVATLAHTVNTNYLRHRADASCPTPTR